MANYLYNGVELPQLPEWDKTTYPYAVIYEVNYDSMAGTAHKFELALSKQPWVWHNDLLATGVTDKVIGYSMDVLNGETEWGELIEKTDVNSAGYWKTGYIGTYPKWANHDVYNANYQYGGIYLQGDELYLAASDPIPVGGEPIDPTSFMQGYIVGRRINAMRGKLPIQPPVLEPDAYLYNGTALPKLPNTDSPYVFIGIKDDEYYVVARAIAAPVFLEDGIPKVKTAMHDPVYSLENGAWVEGFGSYRSFNPIWSGYDIYYASNTDENGELAGTLYLAASEPVGVTIEPGKVIFDVALADMDGISVYEDVAELDLVVGNTYSVKMDSGSYSTVCKALNIEGTEVKYIGNPSLLGEEDTGESFIVSCAVTEIDGSSTVSIIDTANGTHCTISTTETYRPVSAT